MCIGSEVKAAILGHSHAGVTGSYDHLQMKTWVITRNHYTTDNIKEVVVKQMEQWRDDLASKKIPAQNNTAVAAAFDKVADTVELRERPMIVYAITDGDETEYGGVPAPRDKGNLKNTKIIMLGAGITLTSGTEGQRKLRADWQKFFKTAGAEKFVWIATP